MPSAKIASRIWSVSPRTTGISERPCSHGGRSISSSSHSVGKMSMCDTIASEALPPRKPPGPRMISITPMPRSVIVAFAPGNAMPWSVVQITSVLPPCP